jgi:hypothetical protein
MSQRQQVSVSKRSSESIQESYPYLHQPPGFYIPSHVATYGPSPPPSRGPNPTSTYAPGPPSIYGPSPPAPYMEYHPMGTQHMQFPMHCYGSMPPMAYAPYSMYPPVAFPANPFPARPNENISDTSMEENDRECRFETISVESESGDTDYPSISTRRRIDSTPEQVSLRMLEIVY